MTEKKEEKSIFTFTSAVFPPISPKEKFVAMIRVLEGENIDSEKAARIDKAISDFAEEHGIVYLK